MRPLPSGHQALSTAPQPAPAKSLPSGRHHHPSQSLRRRVIAAAVPFVIVRARKQVRRKKRRGAGVVFPFLRSRHRVIRILWRTAGSVRPVAGFTRRGDGGRGLSGVSDAEHSGCGRGLRKCGVVKEGVGRGGGGSCDRGEGGRRL